MTTAICWIRRDLRLFDNQALAAALAHAERVATTYILDPTLLARYDGSKRVGFLFGCLRQLDDGLRARGSYLVVRQGDAAEELARLVRESGAEGVYAEKDFDPYARERDARVAKRVPLRLVSGSVLRPPGVVLKANGEPYTVYTPYSRRWKSFAPPHVGELHPAPQHIPTPPGIAGLPVPGEPIAPEGDPYPPGEAEAQRRLRAFVEGPDAPIYCYAEGRDRIDLEGTSRLSPYLRFGMLSARQAIAAAHQAMDDAADDAGRRGAETWLNELIWREFYVSILDHFPRVLVQSFRAAYQAIPWQNDERDFAAWREGQTGYPIVDAAMRQLVETGWMHNRARMIVASFLVKDLLIDWRWGEGHFMQRLVDGDPAANNGGWQWSAGTGTDAAPYFRILNPVLQGKKHDPQGAFVRRWLPELAHVPGRYIHQPWEMPGSVQAEAGCRIGVDYPPPVVDHGWARERTLSAYARARAEHKED